MLTKLIMVCSSLILLTGCEAISGKAITLEKYNQIQEGMSQSDVMGILGKGNCTESASNSMAGVPGVMDSIKTVAFSCQNKDGSNIQIMFQNDKLMSKAQAGL